MVNRVESIAMENYARRSYNYQENMIDKDGLPYFDIFWTEPAEAAHDWPDFGDVMSRQLQGAIMARVMTGIKVKTEDLWLGKILALIDPQTGFLTRPETNYSKKVADPGDKFLTFYTLVTAYLESNDHKLRDIIFKMIDGMLEKVENEGIASGFLGGFGIKGAMVCARYMDYEPALTLASKMIDTIFNQTPYFSPDNSFRHGGHMHGNLRSLVGAADYALYTNEPVLYSRVDAIYRYVRSQATSFGFLSEVIGRNGDIISCETCALMDYLGLVITLANHGHPEYWNDIEKITRNHLIESQVVDGSWMISDPLRQDTDQFTWRSVGDRMVGGYAGWSSPTHILAARETLNMHWGGKELKDKTRAFQNCCGGSGTHAFFEVWKNSSRFENGCLNIHMHLDKSLPQAEIRSFQPYFGQLNVTVKQPVKIRVRIPEFIHPNEMKVLVNANAVEGKVWGNYMELPEQKIGDEIKINYPLPVNTEDVTIGNPGYKQYRYRVTWKGDTVTRMEPLDSDDLTGYSDFDKKEVQVFYGKKGPGTLYTRETYMKDIEPSSVQPAQLQLDKGLLDFWYFN
jgi:hypothetical protein